MIKTIRQQFQKVKTQGLNSYTRDLLLNNTSTRQTILKNTFWLMLAEGVSKGLAFFLTILIARYLGAEGYGKFSFAFAFVALFAPLADFGLSTLTIREVTRNKKLIKKYIDNIAAIKLILGIITFGLTIIVIQFLGKTPETKILVYLAGIWVVIQSFTQFFQSIFRAFEKMQYEALSKIIYSILLFGIAFFMIWQDLGIKLIAQSYVYASLIAFILTLILVRKKFTKFWVNIDFNFWKKLLKRSKFLFIISLLWAIYYKIDIIVLGIMSSEISTGIYSLSYRFFEFFNLLIVLFSSSLFPLFSERKITKNWVKDKIKEIFLLSILLYLFIFILISYTPVLDKLFPNYHGLGVNLKILFLGLIALYPSTIINDYLKANSREKIIAKVVIFAACINIILNYALIPLFAHNGAAIATVVTESMVLLISYSIFKKSKE